MRLFDRSFWTFVAHTGRIPDASKYTPSAGPLCERQLSVAFLSPGADILDPQAVADKVEANTIAIPKPVLAMVPLQPQRILSDAMGVPAALIAPVHQTIATYLKGA